MRVDSARKCCASGQTIHGVPPNHTHTMVKAVEDWPDSQFIADEDDDHESTRWYWTANCCCPVGPESPCMQKTGSGNVSPWKRVQTRMWTYISSEVIREKMVHHLTHSDKHGLAREEAEQTVDAFLHENPSAIEVHEESPADREAYRRMHDQCGKDVATATATAVTRTGNNIARLKRAMQNIDTDVLGTAMLKAAIDIMDFNGATPVMVKDIEGMLAGYLGRDMVTVMRDRLDNGAMLEVQTEPPVQPAGQTALMRGMVDQLLAVRSLLETHEADTQDRIRCLSTCITEIQHLLRASSALSSSSSAASASSSKRPRTVIGQRSVA